MSPRSAATVIALVDGRLLRDGVGNRPLTAEVVRSRIRAVLVELEGPVPDGGS